MPKVLLVDDEPSIRWTMAEFLKRGGYERARPPPTSTSALGSSATTEMDVAVVDIEPARQERHRAAQGAAARASLTSPSS